jgi:twitching motility two-component system response regulator PilG
MNHPFSNLTDLENQNLEIELPLPDFIEDIIRDLAMSEATGCLRVACDSVIYFVYVNQGKLIYATNSLAPFERLERHLRRLSNHNPKLTNEIIKQARLKFKTDLDQYEEIPSDYQGIFWLITENYLEEEEGLTLLRRISREVFESLLNLSQEFNSKLISSSALTPQLYQFELISFLEQCQQRLTAWQAFAPEIWSSYQRLYLVTQSTNIITNLTVEQNKTICKLLTGLNFRQISALIDKDELIVAKILYSAIINGIVIVRKPKPPFSQIPNLPSANTWAKPVEDWQKIDDKGQHNSNSKETIQLLEKSWKIACIDNDVAVHEEIKVFLYNNIFQVSFINNSLKALAELIDLVPDLILLDENMPNLNGYELSRLVKTNKVLKDIPIIMLFDQEQSINISKVKKNGVTDYLNKPFTQSDLFNIIFKYLP